MLTFSCLYTGGFWCHEDSPLIHPVGWARRIGQDIDAPRTYMDRCYKGLRDKDDATEDLFPIPEVNPYCLASQGFQEGMKLEAVDPLNLSAICVASVMKVSIFYLVQGRWVISKPPKPSKLYRQYLLFHWI